MTDVMVMVNGYEYSCSLSMEENIKKHFGDNITFVYDVSEALAEEETKKEKKEKNDIIREIETKLKEAEALLSALEEA